MQYNLAVRATLSPSGDRYFWFDETRFCWITSWRFVRAPFVTGSRPLLSRGGTGKRISDSHLNFAAACGALVCGGAGGIDPQPTQAQVEAFLGGVS